jgi:hypothetical protein
MAAMGARTATLRSPRGVIGAAMVLWAGALLPVAEAQPEPRAVDVVFAGDAIESSGLAPVIEELLDRVSVRVRQGAMVAQLDPRDVLTPRPDAEAALARIWIEIGADRTTIYLVDEGWERILIRHVDNGGVLDEVHRERVAHIVYAAVDALLAGARIGLSRSEAEAELGIAPEPPPRVEEPPPDEPTPPPELAGEVQVGYGLDLFADGPTPRHAIFAYGALLVGAGSPRAAIGLGLAFWPTTSHLGAGLRLDLRSFLLRVEGGVEVDLSADTQLRLTGGLALDVTAVEPRSVEGSATIVGQAWDAVAPLLCLRLGLTQRLVDWFYVHGGVLLDMDLIDTHYVIDAGGVDETVLDPWLVRPTIYLGLAARL